MAACFRLVSPLKIQEEEEQEQQDEKGCLMVMADPSDHGHGKKVNFIFGKPIGDVLKTRSTYFFFKLQKLSSGAFENA